MGLDLTWWLEKDEVQLEVHAVRTPAKVPSLPEGMRAEKEFDDTVSLVLRVAGAESSRVELSGNRGIWKAVGEPEEAFEVRTASGRRSVSSRALLAISDKHADETAALNSVRSAVSMVPPFGVPGRLDEALHSFDSITHSNFELSREGRGGGGGTFGPWLPVEFMPAATEPASQMPLVIPFDKLGSLGFVSGEVHPRVLKRSEEGQKVSTFYHGFDCLFRRADGSLISHELLSFGQKRLFSFLWYLAARQGHPNGWWPRLPVVADELLNGLHHDWIEVCFDRLRDCQSFLATQHPFLLDHIPIESADAARTSFVRCSLGTGPDGREQMVWRNFTEDEAERFFTAYQTGIQQVSEVLRTEGLW